MGCTVALSQLCFVRYSTSVSAVQRLLPGLASALLLNEPHDFVPVGQARHGSCLLHAQRARSGCSTECSVESRPHTSPCTGYIFSPRAAMRCAKAKHARRSPANCRQSCAPFPASIATAYAPVKQSPAPVVSTTCAPHAALISPPVAQTPLLTDVHTFITKQQWRSIQSEMGRPVPVLP